MLNEEVTKWTQKEDKEKIIEKIIKTKKPISYIYLAGFEVNGVAVYEEKRIDSEKTKELFSYFENYFIVENENTIEIKRIDTF